MENRSKQIYQSFPDHCQPFNDPIYRSDLNTLEEENRKLRKILMVNPSYLHEYITEVIRNIMRKSVVSYFNKIPQVCKIIINDDNIHDVVCEIYIEEMNFELENRLIDVENDFLFESPFYIEFLYNTNDETPSKTGVVLFNK